MLKRVIDTYIDDRLLLPGSFLSGIVYQLEDGTLIAQAHEGTVVPLTDPMTPTEYEAWIEKNSKKQ